MAVFIIFFLSIYAVINSYVFYRAWKLILAGYLPLPFYVTLVLLLTSSYIIGVLFGNKVLKLAGSFWMVGMAYCLFLFVLIDIYRLIARWVNIPALSAWLPGAGLLLILLLLGYGYWNARVTRVVDYTVPTAAGSPALTVVAVSDLHLGDVVGLDRYERMVQEVNALDPDLILFIGDIFDGSLTQVDTAKFSELSRRLQSRYGVYGVLGNHDQYAGPETAVIPPLTAGNIFMLRDELVSPCPGLYLAGGRPAHNAKDNTLAADFAAQAVETNWPVIFMDHIPSRIAAAREAGIFLTICGHTHHGQCIPANLITSWIFENSHGLKQVGGTYSLVTSGYGTWGPPIRIGTHSEILRVRLVPEN